MIRLTPISTLSPYTTLFLSGRVAAGMGDPVAVMAALPRQRDRSVDAPVEERTHLGEVADGGGPLAHEHPHGCVVAEADAGDDGDRKSTRLNSSHANISYAVF